MKYFFKSLISCKQNIFWEFHVVVETKMMFFDYADINMSGVF